MLGADAAKLTIDFTYLPSHPLGLADLALVAREMGALHAAIHQTHTFDANLARPLLGQDGQPIAADFYSIRRTALARRLEGDEACGAWFNASQADHILAVADGSPAVIYKDSNPRNFLLRGDDLITIDFDDLTLAPPGYDLGKLIVAAAMTCGPVQQTTIELILVSYNAALHRRTPPAHRNPALRCTLAQLYVWLEVHFVLTAAYHGQSGYRYRWSDIRPPGASRLFQQGLSTR